MSTGRQAVEVATEVREALGVGGLPLDDEVRAIEGLAAMGVRSPLITQVARFAHADPYWAEHVTSCDVLWRRWGTLRDQAAAQGFLRVNGGDPLDAADAIDAAELDKRTRKVLANFRRNIAGGELFGEPYLSRDDLEQACSAMEPKIRDRIRSGMRRQATAR